MTKLELSKNAVEKELISCRWGYKLAQPLWKTIWQELVKLKKNTLNKPEVPLELSTLEELLFMCTGEQVSETFTDAMLEIMK